MAAVATDAEHYAALWARFVARPDAPRVDFTKESVVFLSLGTRRTGGYALEPKQVASDGDTVVITVNVTTPPPGGMVTMAFSSPYAVVAVDRPNVKAARWVDPAGTVVAEVK